MGGFQANELDLKDVYLEQQEAQDQGFGTEYTQLMSRDELAPFLWGRNPLGFDSNHGQNLGGMFFRLTLCMFCREPNRPLLHFAGPGCPGGQSHHRWCGCRHLPVHRWTAVLITLQPPLKKSLTVGGWQGKISAHDKTKQIPHLGRYIPEGLEWQLPPP